MSRPNGTNAMGTRVLIYRLGSLGDTCVALPAFRVVRRYAPQARITLLTNLPVNLKAAPAPALLAGMGLIDDYLAYPVGTRNPWLLASLAWKLRRLDFDLVVNLTEWRGPQTLRRDRLFFRCCGIPRLIGFDSAVDHGLRRADGDETEREAARLLRRVASLGEIDLQDPQSFALGVTADEAAEAGAVLRQGHIPPDFVAFSIGTKVSVNDWGQDNWRTLVSLVGGNCGSLGCVFVGSADELPRVRELMAAWPGPALNLCGQVGPRLSGAVLARARVFVGHDSGPMHLAASVGTPCVAIFSARNPPGAWFPLGPGHRIFYRPVDCMKCGLETCVTERKKCITGIGVTEVANEVLRRLTKSTDTRAGAPAAT